MADAFLTLVAVQPRMSTMATEALDEAHAIQNQGVKQSLYGSLRIRDVSGATGGVPGGTPAPAAPTGFTLTPIGDTVQVTWSPVADAASYVVLWTQDITLPLASWSQGTSVSSSFTTGHLASGIYFFVVRAVTSDGVLGQPTDALKVISAFVPLLPAPLSFTPQTFISTVALWWQPVAGATGYALYYAANPGAGKNGTRVTSVVPPFISSIPAGYYYFTICTLNAAGEGDLSPETLVRVHAPLAIDAISTPPRKTTQLTASGGTDLGFVWSIQTNNSGASITAGGLYTAGTTPSVTDVVKVVDSSGASITQNITVTASVSITGASSSPPRGQVALTATGGAGAGFVWSLQTNNSGGTIDSGTGIYTAGATPSVTDTVLVVDPYGNSATKALTVGVGVSIAPLAPSVTPGTQQQFTASGGSGTGFGFTLLVNNSGGGITSGGLYTAGATPATDTVGVVDSLGNTASTTAVVAYQPLVIAPANPSVVTGAQQQFTVSGGSGVGYTFTLLANLSGGSITAGGLYTAGATPGVADVVQVTDSLGGTATTNASVLAATLIPVDAGSVAHVYVKNGALVDLKGNAWSKQGAGPTMNAAGSIFGKTAESMGPFSSVDFFQLGAAFNDPFTADTIANYTGVVGAWSVDTSAHLLKVQSCAVGYPGLQLPAAANMQDGAIHFVAANSSGGAKGLYLQFRVVDGNNLLQLSIDAGVAKLWDVTAGSWTLKGSISNAACAFAAGVTHTIHVAVSGLTITLYIDGVSLGALTSARTAVNKPVQLITSNTGASGNFAGEMDFSSLSVAGDTAGSSDVLDFAGDFLVTVIGAVQPAATNCFLSNGASGTSGYYLVCDATNGWRVTAGTTCTTSYASMCIPQDVTTPHIFSFGRAGSSYFMKVDGAPVMTGAFALTAGSGFPARLGRYQTGSPFTGKLWELRATTTTPSAAALDALHAGIMDGTYVLKDANTVALYEFESVATGAAGIKDNCGSYNLDVTNAPALTAGVRDNAYSSGTSYGKKQVDAGFSAVVKGDFTVEGWFNAPTSLTSAFPALLGIGPDEVSANRWLLIYLDRDGAFFPNQRGISVSYYSSGSDVETPGGAFDLGVWTHLAFRRKSLGGGSFQMDLFVNGALVATRTGPAITNASTPYLSIGANVAGGSQASIAYDTWRISNKYRSDAEITAFYQNTGAAAVPAPAVVIPVETSGKVFDLTQFTTNQEDITGATATGDTSVLIVRKTAYDFQHVIQTPEKYRNVYATPPAALLAGDFSFDFQACVAAAVDTSNCLVFGVSTVTHSHDYLANGGAGHDLVVIMRQNTGASGRFFVVQQRNGATIPLNVASSTLWVLGTIYYLRFAKTGSNYTLSIYTDRDRTVLQEQMTGALGETVPYTYLQACTMTGGRNVRFSVSNLVPTDGNVIAWGLPASLELVHLYVSGGALHDTTGTVWTRTGTPPFNGAAALGFPNGKSAESIGGFSDANYLTLNNTSKVMDLLPAEDFTFTFIVKGGFAVTGQVDFFHVPELSANGLEFNFRGSSAGNYGINASFGGTSALYIYPSPYYFPDANAHLYSLSRKGDTFTWKIDGGPAVSAPSTLIPTPNTAAKFFIGREGQFTGYAWGGQFIELRVTSKGMSPADLDALHLAIRGA